MGWGQGGITNDVQNDQCKKGVSTTFESDDRSNLCFDGLFPSSETVTKTGGPSFRPKKLAIFSCQNIRECDYVPNVKSTFRVATSDWSAGNFAEIAEIFRTVGSFRGFRNNL